MQATPKGLRWHIGFFGRRNVGKSALLNALVRQDVSIVSPEAGTTTDPVEKAMELRPLGPVLFVDTAGVDDVGALGALRVQKTMAVVARTDLCVLVTDDWQEYEQRLAELFDARGVPVVVAVSKCDLGRAEQTEAVVRAAGRRVVRTSAVTGEGLDALRQALIEASPEERRRDLGVVGDLISPGDLVVLVVPIDLEAPKGRLILPQVQTLRDVLDHDGYALVVKERELPDAMARLKEPPSLVITDSQEFLKVAADTPSSVRLTSFSILFARAKGDLVELARGAAALDHLQPGDRVLMAEACSHHPSGEDIGRVKLPRWIQQHVGGALQIDVCSGRGFPETLSDYDLIVHCGACVWNRREMMSRIDAARRAGVPITNYGLAIAASLGILERALEPFPGAWEAYQQAKKVGWKRS